MIARSRSLKDSTQRPWSWQAAANVDDGIHIGSDSNNAAWVPGFNDHPHNIANADLIVRAVNSYEPLLDLLRFVSTDPCFRLLGSVTQEKVLAALSASEAEPSGHQ